MSNVCQSPLLIIMSWFWFHMRSYLALLFFLEALTVIDVFPSPCTLSRSSGQSSPSPQSHLELSSRGPLSLRCRLSLTDLCPVTAKYIQVVDSPLHHHSHIVSCPHEAQLINPSEQTPRTEASSKKNSRCFHSIVRFQVLTLFQSMPFAYRILANRTRRVDFTLGRLHVGSTSLRVDFTSGRLHVGSTSRRVDFTSGCVHTTNDLLGANGTSCDPITCT